MDGVHKSINGGDVIKLTISDQFMTFDQHIYMPLILK